MSTLCVDKQCYKRHPSRWAKRNLHLMKILIQDNADSDTGYFF